MKIYFHASVSQRDIYGPFYKRIVDRLTLLGYEVDATHALQHDMPYLLQRDVSDTIKEDYEAAIERIELSDMLVFEVSFPSTIVTGHLLTRALERGKPVLGLYHEKSTSALLRGFELERFRLAEYSEADLEKVLEFELEALKQMPDQRFTMLLPHDLIHYLDTVADSGLSRSEFIRGLIRNYIKKGNNE